MLLDVALPNVDGDFPSLQKTAASAGTVKMSDTSSWKAKLTLKTEFDATATDKLTPLWVEQSRPTNSDEMLTM